MSLSRRRTLAVSLALVAAAGTGSALGASIRGDDLVACRNKGQVELRKDGWLKIMAPPVTPAEGPREIVDFAAPPDTPKILFATNGAVIKNSADGGCEWAFLTDGLEPPKTQAGDVPARPDQFTHLVAPGPGILLAAGYDDVNGVPRPHVYQFTDLDQDPPTEARFENGLPPVGTPVEFLATSGAQPHYYLLVEEPADAAAGRAEATRKLYTMVLPSLPDQLANAVDNVWREVPAPPDFGRMEGLTVAPGGVQLWIRSATHYATTLDATADDVSWVTHPSPGGAITALDVNSLGEALVTARDGQGFRAERADRKGKVLGGTDVPVLPAAMTHGRGALVRVLSGDQGTWGFDQDAMRWVDISLTGVKALRDLTMASGVSERIVLGHTGDALYRFDTYSGETFRPDDGSSLPPLPPPPSASFKDPYLDVRPEVVTVEPGKVEEADVEFGMPPSAHPLDVFFVVDTTGSMQAAIDGLRKDIYSIAARLREELGDDVCFGVGEFKDASASPNDVGKVYRVHQKIVCELDPALPLIANGLSKEKMAANGGGTEASEAQTIALTEMVTGEGRPRPLVLPDQDAEFRDQAYKVAVLITDINFTQVDTAHGDYETIEEVGAELRPRGVKVVSVLPRTDWDPALGRADMTELARVTDSFAPPGTSVDCDADGRRSDGDVPPGGPLVCETSGSEPNIGPIITSLLFGVVDPGTVDVGVNDPFDVVGAPTKGTTPQIMNLKRESKLPLTLPVTCTPEQDGLDLLVTFHATVRALPVDIKDPDHLLVRCRSVPDDPLPKPPEPPEPPIFEKPITRQVLAVALVPPANPPVQPISNVNLNAGFSQQEEQQFQVATVTQGASDEEAEDVELAMTGLERGERTTPVGAFVAATMTLTAGFALAYRRRLQHAAAPSRVRIS